MTQLPIYSVWKARIDASDPLPVLIERVEVDMTYEDAMRCAFEMTTDAEREDEDVFYTARITKQYGPELPPKPEWERGDKVWSDESGYGGEVDDIRFDSRTGYRTIRALRICWNKWAWGDSFFSWEFALDNPRRIRKVTMTEYYALSRKQISDNDQTFERE